MQFPKDIILSPSDATFRKTTSPLKSSRYLEHARCNSNRKVFAATAPRTPLRNWFHHLMATITPDRSGYRCRGNIFKLTVSTAQRHISQRAEWEKTVMARSDRRIQIPKLGVNRWTANTRVITAAYKHVFGN